MFQVLQVPEARVSAPLTYTGSHLHTESSISYYFTVKNNMLTFTLFPLQSEAGNIQNISRASTFAATLCNFHTEFLAEGFTWLRKLSFHSRKMLSWAGLEHGPDKQDVVRLFFCKIDLISLKWSKYLEGRRDLSWRMTTHVLFRSKSHRRSENWVRKM